MIEVWEGLIADMSSEEKETATIIMWATWNFRNKITMGATYPNVQYLIRQIKRQKIDQSKCRSFKERNLTAESQENHETWTPRWGM